MNNILIKDDNHLIINEELNGIVYNDRTLILNEDEYNNIINEHLSNGYELYENKIASLVKLDVNNSSQHIIDMIDDGKDLTVRETGKTISSTTHKTTDWDDIYTRFIKSGYVDVTANKKISTKNTFDDIADNDIRNLYDFMKQNCSNNIKANYKNIDSVSISAIYRAQKQLDILNSINKLGALKDNINFELYKLYHIIPRVMTNVKDHFVGSDIDTTTKMSDLKTLLYNEEQLLLNLKTETEIKKQNVIGNDNFKNKNVKNNIFTELDALGVNITKGTQSDIDIVNDLIKKSNSLISCSYNNVTNVYAINNPKVETNFKAFVASKKDKTTELLFHGLYSQYVLNTLVNSKIVYNNTGSMFGNGIYFSRTHRKALGYTSRYNGDKYLFIFEVHTGNSYTTIDSNNVNRQLEYDCHNYQDFVRIIGDYDSLNVVPTTWWDDYEQVIYQNNQCTLRYLITLN